MRWTVSTHAIIRFTERAVGFDPHHAEKDLHLGLHQAQMVETKTKQNSLLFRCEKFFCYFVARRNLYGPGMVVRTVLGWSQGQRYEKSTLSPEEELLIAKEEEFALHTIQKEVFSLESEMSKLRQLPPAYLDLLHKGFEAQIEETKEVQKTLRHQISMNRSVPLLDLQNRVKAALREVFREPDLEHARLRWTILMPEILLDD